MSDQFSFSDRIGLLFTAEAAFLSIIAVSTILFYALYKFARRTLEKKIRDSEASDSGIFLNLMLADLIQGIGTMPNIKWMSDGIVTEGDLCHAQAALKQIGIVGVAMTSLAIAIHTFVILVLRQRIGKHTSKYVVLSIWICTALVTGVPYAVHRNEQYYGRNGFWCWIIPKFKAEAVVTEYLWVWFAGFSMLVLYTIMFFVMRGWFIIDNGIHWHESYEHGHDGPVVVAPETADDKEAKAIAKMMLYYPAVYILCILPNTISRWLTFSGHHPPGGFILFANTVFSLSGLLNLILFLFTRPAMVVGNDITVEVESVSPTHKPAPSDYTMSTLGHLPEHSDVEKQNSPVSPPSSRGGASVNRMDRERYTRPQSPKEDEDDGHLPG